MNFKRVSHTAWYMWIKKVDRYFFSQHSSLFFSQTSWSWASALFSGLVVMLLSVNFTYNEQMTHLPLGRLGHRGCDHHKAPQHIEPGGMKNRGVKEVADLQDVKYQQVEWGLLQTTWVFHDLNVKLLYAVRTHTDFHYSLWSSQWLSWTFFQHIHLV